MRKSVEDLLKKTIAFKYNLPNGAIEKSIYSTKEDYCYCSLNDIILSKIIYNALIDYAFNENEIQDDNLDSLQIEAITQRMRIEETDNEETQLRYGFFGEVLFNLVLQLFFGSSAIIAKGYFYDILHPEEPKGYDSYHFIMDKKNIQLWFGEVKFHTSYKSAIDSVFSNIEKAISDSYFRNNLLALTPKKNDLNTSNATIKSLLDHLRNNPYCKISDLVENFGLQFTYPIFITCENLNNYDTTISSIISYIKNKYPGKSLDIGLNYDLFFILLPVTNVKKIKQTVLRWIKLKEPLTLS